MTGNGNLFTQAAKKATQDHDQKLKVAKAPVQNGKDDLIVTYNLRLPRYLRTRCQQHRVDTGENMNQLLLRLLYKEFDD